MLQVNLPFEGRVSESRLNAEVVPVGFRAEMENSHSFRVFDDDHRSYQGTISVEEDGSLFCSFICPVTTGADYVAAFGLKHPDHNPTQVLFGIVYRTGNGLFQLDKNPWTLESQAMEEAAHDTNADAYVVRFVRGEWEPFFLKVTGMRKILPGGELGNDTGPKLLELGNIENPATM